jgi:ERCC4-type nuclease
VRSLVGRQFWSSSHNLKDDYPDPDRLEAIPGLGETKLARLNDAGIHTLSDVRLVDEEELVAVDGISADFAERMKEIVGDPSNFDLYSFDFVGAASWSEMPANWSDDAQHYGVPLG